MRRSPSGRVIGVVLGMLLAGACASAPPPPPEIRPRPQRTYEEKMAWILRLEEDRVLEIPAPPAPPPSPAPATPQRRGRTAPVVVPEPPANPDLLTLLKDDDPRIRRRAALAVGRTRQAGGAQPLTAVLAGDSDPEVRQMAAFAIGLVGDASVADALVTALGDAEPSVQGRAAEGLGLLAHKPAADAIAAMMAAHVTSGALANIPPDDLVHPKAGPIEAVRLGMYALVRLGAVDQLMSVLVEGGQPVTRWWPVAYAFRRVGDPKAAPILLALLQGEGVFTRGFAARGLGALKDARAVTPLVAVLANSSEVVNVRIEAARALADLQASQAADALAQILTTPKLDPNLRLEAATALGQLRSGRAVELFVDLATDPWPSMRAAALTGLARADGDTFVTVISGLDPDPHWSVRAALATALGTLGAERASARLTLMLQDNDQRVIPAVLRAIVAVRLPDAESTLVQRLEADDLAVRQAAVDGLAQLKAVGQVRALVQAYERADKDPSYTVRAAILNAVLTLDRDGARPLLERALTDRDWALRVRAAALLKSVDPSADLSKMRPAPASPVAELNDLQALMNPKVSPIAYIDTDKGTIQIELAVLDAPRTVANFLSLARRSFLGATPFHRVVPNFVAQDGDPRGDGEGGPGYTIRDEINQLPYLRGTVGMALEWEDTGGSQFFITYGPQPHLDGRYTVFGRVVAGMEVVDRLTQWDQIRAVRVWDGVNWVGAR
jgi:HEAT repeat protein/cyclophilin family peptidyl-prolyl cis-trans isomerase